MNQLVIDRLRLYISENPNVSNRKLQELFGIDRKKISKLKNEMNIPQTQSILTNEEKYYIISNAHIKTSTKLAQEMNKPASTIRRVWQEHGVKINQNFNIDRDEFINRYEELLSSRKMAEYYNVSHKTILNFAKEIGYVNQVAKERLLKDEQIQEIVDSYEQSSASKLAEKYGCSGSRISQIWSNAGLIGKDNRTYYSNFNYFENMNTKDVAYFLGFIAADGCVYSRNNDTQQDMLNIGINRKDEYLLSTFLRYLNSENPINYSLQLNENNTEIPVASIQIVSDKLCKDLGKYNIKPQKTWNYSPCNIKESLLWHFIRGYFDGDGSISHKRDRGDVPSSYQVNIVGNKFLVGFISAYLKYNDINFTIAKDNRRYNGEFYCLFIGNIKSKYKFLNNLYADCDDLYLPRKKKLSDKFIELCNNNITKRVKL